LKLRRPGNRVPPKAKWLRLLFLLHNWPLSRGCPEAQALKLARDWRRAKRQEEEVAQINVRNRAITSPTGHCCAATPLVTLALCLCLLAPPSARQEAPELSQTGLQRATFFLNEQVPLCWRTFSFLPFSFSQIPMPVHEERQRFHRN